MPDELRFDGRVAIITGAGRGLGRAYALDLARRGARIVVNDPGFDMGGTDRGDPGPANPVVGEIAAAGGTAVASLHDIARPDAGAALVELALSRWGRVDILVNNAGNNRRAVFSEMTLEDFRALLDVHLIGAFAVTQAAYRVMAAKGYGRIVMTTSQVGFYGKIDSVGYGAAKAGLVGLMQGMKQDAAARGIRVNAIAPFAISRMSNQFPADLATLMDPAFVAAAVVYLCSEACGLNGEIIVASGGHFGRARTLESRGIDLSEPCAITAETVAARWDAIADMADPIVHDDAVQSVRITVDRLKAAAARGPGAS